MSNPIIPVESPVTLMLIVIGVLVIVVAVSALWGWKAERRNNRPLPVEGTSALPTVERPLRRTAVLGPAMPFAASSVTATVKFERRRSANAPAALSRRPGLTNRWKGAHRLVAQVTDTPA